MKNYPLRIEDNLVDRLYSSAKSDLRSVNSQINILLLEALDNRNRDSE